MGMNSARKRYLDLQTAGPLERTELVQIPSLVGFPRTDALDRLACVQPFPLFEIQFHARKIRHVFWQILQDVDDLVAAPGPAIVGVDLQVEGQVGEFVFKVVTQMAFEEVRARLDKEDDVALLEPGILSARFLKEAQRTESKAEALQYLAGSGAAKVEGFLST
jgi:hypothetical protein